MPYPFLLSRRPQSEVGRRRGARGSGPRLRMRMQTMSAMFQLPPGSYKLRSCCDVPSNFFGNSWTFETAVTALGVRATPRLSRPQRGRAGRNVKGTEHVRRHTVCRRHSWGSEPPASSTTQPSSRSRRLPAGTEVSDRRAVLGTACLEDHPAVYDSFVLEPRGTAARRAGRSRVLLPRMGRLRIPVRRGLGHPPARVSTTEPTLRAEVDEHIQEVIGPAGAGHLLIPSGYLGELSQSERDELCHQ